MGKGFGKKKASRRLKEGKSQLIMPRSCEAGEAHMKRDVLSVSIISKIEQECYRVIPDLTVRNTLAVIVDTCFSKGGNGVSSCIVLRDAYCVVAVSSTATTVVKLWSV